MELIDPFEDVFKAAETVPAQSATVVRVLVPTGNNVGHGLDLKRATARTKGPRRPALERYGRKVHKGVGRGLFQTGNFKPSRVPTALPQSGRVQRSALGSRLAGNKRTEAMERLRSTIPTPNSSTRGRRAV